MPITIICLTEKGQILLFIPIIIIDPKRITEIEMSVAMAAPVIPMVGINKIFVLIINNICMPINADIYQ